MKNSLRIHKWTHNEFNIFILGVLTRPQGNGKDEKEKKQSALPYLIIDREGECYQKLIRATLLVAWGLQNQ